MKTTFVMTPKIILTPTPVTASEARQSMNPWLGTMDCRASLAMTSLRGAA